MARLFGITCTGLLFLSCLPLRLQAQEGRLRFERFSVEQGLSSAVVHTVRQDRRGFLWIATERGLNRYDGYRFIVYQHEPLDTLSIEASWVDNLFEDHTGMLWLDLYVPGLSRFDPETGHFNHFRHDPDDPYSINEGHVSFLYEDRAGNLWVGMQESGLNRFDRATEHFTRYVHDPHDTQSLGCNRVTFIHEDRAGTLWIGTYGGGLNRFDRATGHFTRYRHDPDDPHSLSDDRVRGLHEDLGGVLWVGTQGGLNRFDRATGHFTRYRHDPVNPQSLSHDGIRALYEAPSHPGTLWIVTDGGGLDRLDTTRGQVKHYTHDAEDRREQNRPTLFYPRVHFVYEDRSGTLWIGSAMGLFTFDWQTETFDWYGYKAHDANSLSHSDVSSVFEDRSGVLWFGTRGGGLNKLNPSQQRFNHVFYDPTYRNITGPNAVWAIYQDEAGVLWLGTVGGGLVRYNRETGEVARYRHDPSDPRSLSHDFVSVIYEAPTEPGILWVGTYDGLNRFDLTTGTFTRYRHDPEDSTSLGGSYVRALVEDHTGTLWVGTDGGGLARLDRATGQFTRYPCGDRDPKGIGYCEVLALYEDRAGILWIGMPAMGLHRYNRETETFTRYLRDPNDPEERGKPRSIFALHEDRTGTLWIGGYSSGLTKFDRETGAFVAFTRQHGLPSNFVNGILEDEQGHLWLSTDHGLSRFNPHTLTIKTYDVDDGLQHNRFLGTAYWKGRDGELFFGGIDGLNSFYPDRLADNPHVPPIALTAFEVFDQEGASRVLNDLSEDQGLAFSFRENLFTVEFAALDFTNPEKNQYAYKLDGLDEEWTYSGTRRFARYTNLDPGRYVLRVKGSNNDGVWNEAGVSLPLRIRPPFWQTGWFYLLAAGFLVSLAWAFHTLRVKTEARRLLEIERVRRTEQERVRKKAAKDFHDELGHMATRISLFGEILKRNAHANGAVETDYLDRIITTSKSLSSGMGDFIWTLDPAKDSLYEVAVRLKDFGDDLFDKTGIAFRAHGIARKLARIRLSADWRRHLTLIFKEGMHNALKHAACRNVELSIAVCDDELALTLSDDGRGFVVEQQASGQGLRNMQSRAERLQGEVIIDSAIGSGTTITFRRKIPQMGH